MQGHSWRWLVAMLLAVVALGVGACGDDEEESAAAAAEARRRSSSTPPRRWARSRKAARSRSA